MSSFESFFSKPSDDSAESGSLEIGVVPFADLSGSISNWLVSCGLTGAAQTALVDTVKPKMRMMVKGKVVGDQQSIPSRLCFFFVRIATARLARYARWIRKVIVDAYCCFVLE